MCPIPLGSDSISLCTGSDSGTAVTTVCDPATPLCSKLVELWNSGEMDEKVQTLSLSYSCLSRRHAGLDPGRSTKTVWISVTAEPDVQVMQR